MTLSIFLACLHKQCYVFMWKENGANSAVMLWGSTVKNSELSYTFFCFVQVNTYTHTFRQLSLLPSLHPSAKPLVPSWHARPSVHWPTRRDPPSLTEVISCICSGEDPPCIPLLLLADLSLSLSLSCSLSSCAQRLPVYSSSNMQDILARENCDLLTPHQGSPYWLLGNSSVPAATWRVQVSARHIYTAPQRLPDISGVSKCWNTRVWNEPCSCHRIRNLFMNAPITAPSWPDSKALYSSHTTNNRELI